MSASAWSVALLGVSATLVEVEAAVGGGLPRSILVGLPDKALYEARDRCKAAVVGSGLGWPNQLLTINLTPAGLPKSGTHFDLAIIAAVLVAQGLAPAELTQGTVMVGEVTLDGRVQPVRGVLPAVLAASEAGFERAIVPADQGAEAGLVEHLTVWPISHVSELVDVLHGRPVLHRARLAAQPPEPVGPQPDLADVIGQEEAKWALEVAAAGRHHLFLKGAPGVGKTMLAERLPTLLPELSRSEALEVTAIHSMAGHQVGQLISRPPFADPTRGTSMAALVGGGPRIAAPGSVSLAHRGVLFLDEAPEFGSTLLDALRTPLESGWVSIGRSVMTVRFPARFQLVLAANPCPCGNHGISGAECQCNPASVRRYAERVSGPILDRIDITQQLAPEPRSRAIAAPLGESSEVVADRVRQARDRQEHRLSRWGLRTNGEVPGALLRQHLAPPTQTDLLDRALLRGELSARGVDRVLRLGWTVADLAGRDRISGRDLRVALAMRRGAELAALK